MHILRRNSLLLSFLRKDFTSTKKYKTAYSEKKFKNVYKKHLREKSHLFAYLRFVLLFGCVSLNGFKKLVFVSSRQFSFLTGPNKLDFVRMYVSTFTSLVGPPYITLWGLFCFF